MPGGQTSSATTDPAIARAVRAVARWPLRIWLAIEVAAAVWLVTQPLFGVLGYEAALVATLVGSPVALSIGATMARRAARVPADALERLKRGAARPLVGLGWRAAALAAVVTATPALLLAVHGIWVPTCDWGFGVRAYLAMVTTGAVVFAVGGVALGLATARARAWVTVTLGVIVVLAIAAAGFWRFYSEPPVFSYSPLAGYLPGNLYDENIRLDAPLYWARFEQIVWAIAALAIVAALLDIPTLTVRLRERRPHVLRAGALATALAAAAIGIVLHVESGRLGYAVDASDIQDELGGRFETAHFVIHYAKTDEIAARIDLIAEDHEFRLAQDAATLGLTDDDLRRLGKIDSYYFESSEQKGRLMGGFQVDMAKPWRHEIYLSDEPFPHVELRHEIAHVLAGTFGDPWFGVAAKRVLGVPLFVNPGLIEGLAVAVDWPGSFASPLTPHQAVRALEQMGSPVHLGDVLGLGFLSVSPAQSYTVAGSFVKFLLDTRGPMALRRLYASGGDFVDAYGETLDQLEGEWHQMLAGVAISDDQVQMVKEMFRHGSVFARPCPHAVAARAAEATRAIVDGDRPRAVALLRTVCSDSGNDPQRQLALAGALAPGSDDEKAESEKILHALADDDEHVTATIRAEALEGLAGLAYDAGDRTTADADVAQAASLPIPDGLARTAIAKHLALSDTGPAGDTLRSYFFGPDAASLDAAVTASQEEPDLALAWYLRGFKENTSDPAAAVADLEHALSLPLPDRRFVRAAATMLATNGWLAGDHAATARACDLLDGDGATEMDHLLAADWRDRLARADPTSR